MIIIIERITAILLALILIFNMTARRQLTHGSKKRTASLLFAVCILIFYMAVIAVKRNNMPLSLLYPAFAIAFLLMLILNKKIFIFKRKCHECGSSFPMKAILYVDEPHCEKCNKPDLKSKPVPIPDSVDDIDWDKWEPTEKAVITYIIDKKNNMVLLMHKKTGLGKGKVNAPGGRIEPGETPLQAAVRECQEEVSLTPKNLEKRMELNFQFADGYALYGEVFFSEEWEGEAAESDEADPFWCRMDKIPWEKMWADDVNWLPNGFKGKKQRGHYIFDGDEMLSERLEQVECFEEE
ncbi:MAG: NUDIX domain-containing protein [Spirochaetales bacterium]|nr:NUDIX domain-containing protein [Spirochaetales bacterium]